MRSIPQQVRETAAPIDMKFVATTLAFSLVQNRSDHHDQMLQVLLASGVAGSEDLESRKDLHQNIADQQYRYSIAQCQIELLKFVQRVLAHPELLAGGQDAAPGQQVINLQEAIETIKKAIENKSQEFSPHLSHENEVIKTIRTIRQAFGLKGSVGLPQLDSNELRGMEKEHWDTCVKELGERCQELLNIVDPGQELAGNPGGQMTAVRSSATRVLSELNTKQSDEWAAMQASVELFDQGLRDLALGISDAQSLLHEPSLPRELGNPIDVNAQDNLGNTLLHYAIEKGDKTVIPMLLAAGARLDIRNFKGETPLDILGAEILLNCVHEETGNNPLHWAVIHGHLGSFQAFWRFVKEKDSNDQYKIFGALNCKWENVFQVMDKNQNTAWHLVVNGVLDVADGHRDLIHEMMETTEENCRVVQETGGAITLESVVEQPPEYDYAKTCSLLLSKNADNKTPLTVATETAQQEWDKLQRVKGRAARVEEAFSEVVLHLYRELDDLSEKTGSKAHQILNAKLNEVQNAMKRIREGEDKNHVLEELKQLKDIRRRRHWWDFRTPKTQQLISKIRFSGEPIPVPATTAEANMQNSGVFELAIRRRDADLVSASCNYVIDHIWNPNCLFQRIEVEELPEVTEQSQGGALTIQTVLELTPLELAHRQATTYCQQRKELLQRIEHVTQAFALIEGHLKAKRSKYTPGSRDHRILTAKLSAVSEKRNAVIDSKRDIQAVLTELKTDSRITKHRNGWLHFWNKKTHTEKLIDHAIEEQNHERPAAVL